MKHALVTGGAGFIGSHLVDAYLQRGWRVSVIDDLSTGTRDNLDGAAELHVADLRDPGTMPLVETLRPDLISHHAAQIDVRKSVSDPAADAEMNIVATLRLLEAAVRGGTTRFVFASSGGAIYGEPAGGPQRESDLPHPMSPYGCAKLAVDHYMEFFRQVHGLATTSLRYGNVYGPRQRAGGEAGVVAIFLDRLLRDDEVTINGSGEQTRDFVFVEDIVAANMAVSGDDSLVGAFNVGTGVEASVLEVYGTLRELTGATRAPLFAPAKEGEQMRSVIDGSLLRSRAGLAAPQALAEGLRRTTEWFRRR
jgi:UDP-glucose 4-epimerase